MSLIGSLDEVKIADVLRLFAAGKKSGTLTVDRTAGPAAVLHFHGGALLHASCASLSGDVVVLQLFGWPEGQITFKPDAGVVPTNIGRDLEALVAEGTRVGAQLHRTAQLIPSDRAVFQWGPGPADDAAKLQVGRTEWRVLRQLDGLRDVREVVSAAGVAREDVLRVLLDCIEGGFLERVEPQKTLRVLSQGMFGKESVELDARIDEDWRRIQRFSSGVARIEMRTLGGKLHTFAVRYRAGLNKDVQVTRQALTDLGLRDREEVFIRPIG